MTAPAPLRVVLLARAFHPNDGRLLKESAALAERGHHVQRVAPEDGEAAPGVTLVRWRARAKAAERGLLALAAGAAVVLAVLALAAPAVAVLLLAAAAAAVGLGLARLRRRGLAPGRLRTHVRAAIAHRVRTAASVQAVADTRPDVIVAQDPESLPAAVRAKAATGAALLYNAREFHEEEGPEDPGHAAWVRRAETAAGPALDGFLTVNASLARLYAEGRPEFPAATVVHNAAGAGPPPAYDGRLHAAAGLDPQRRVLLFQGGLAPMRGLETLVAAAPLLPEGWAVVLMGWGRLEPALRAAADPGRVKFLPPVAYEELPAWTAGADLGAILYEDVGFNQRYCTPNKIWEFAAAGVPVLASNLPELRRVLGDAGVYLPPGASAAAVAEAVAALDETGLTAARAAGLALAARDNWAVHASRYVEAVEQGAVKRARRTGAGADDVG